MKNKINLSTLKHELDTFMATGEFHRYRPIFPRVLLTDGALYLAEQCECFWLLDKISALQQHPRITRCQQLEEIQFWRLEVADDQTAFLACDWDKGKTVYKEKLCYTDFPLPKVRVWVSKTWLSCDADIEDWFWLLFLPSEY